MKGKLNTHFKNSNNFSSHTSVYLLNKQQKSVDTHI